MAKLSTGQTYGTTSRVTSQRLLGGEAQIATGAPLAQAELGQPALQPQASPVNTFQQVGAPTLGGPLRMFEPPAPPKPSQDFANLVDALSGFNKNLQQYSISMEEVRLAKDQAAIEEGKALGQSLASQYPGENWMAIENRLSKDTTPEGQRAYNIVRGSNPFIRRTADQYVQEANALNQIIAAPAKWETMKMIPVTDVDGNTTLVNRATLEPGNIDVFKAANSLVDMPTNPTALANVLPRVRALQALLAPVHSQEVGDQKLQFYQAGFKLKFRSFIDDPKIPIENKLQQLGSLLQDAYLNVGSKDYQKIIGSLEPMFVEYINMGPADTRGFRVQQATALFATPAGSGIPGDTISTRLGEKGGLTGVLNMIRTSMKANNEDRSLDEGQQTQEGQAAGEQLVTKYQLRDLNIDPLTQERNLQRARIDASQIVNPAKRKAVQTVIDNAEEDRKKSVDEPRNITLGREINRISMTAGDPQDKMNTMLGIINANPTLPPGAYTNAYGKVDRELSKAQEPGLQAINQQVQAVIKKREAVLKQGGYTGEEQRGLIQTKLQLRLGVYRIQIAGQKAGKNLETIQQEQLNYVQNESKKLDGAIDKAAAGSNEPFIPDFRKYVNERQPLFGLFNSKSNRFEETKAAASTRKVTSTAEFNKAFNEWVDNNKVSEDTKIILRDTDTIRRPADYFMKQWNFHYPGVPMHPEQLERVKQLGNQKISSVVPLTTGGSSGGFAMVTPSIAASYNLANLASEYLSRKPPAPPTTQIASSNSTLNLGNGNFNFERPSSVVYEKPGKQPGVDYFFESKKFPAVLGGRVKDVGREPGYGNYVVVESIDPLTGKGVDVLYGHLPDNGIYVKRGQNVQVGEIIGKQGGTGNVRSADGTIASVDFFAVAPEGSKSMTPYSGFDPLRRYITNSLQNPKARPASPKPVGDGLTGRATYYSGSGGNDGVAGGKTKNGEIYNPNKLTAAVQWSLEGKYMNKWIRVEDMDTGKTVRVWVNDVGPMKGDEKSFNRKDPRIVDLSPAAFKKLAGGLGKGVVDRIRIEIDPNQTRR
jgi:Lytic transglycolase/Peptidase family M23